MEIKMSENKVDSLYYPLYIEFKDNNEEISNILYFRYPTNNCQMGSIGKIEQFLSKYNKEDILALFKFIYKKQGRNTILIDIREYQRKLLNFIDKKYFLVDQEYLNTTGNSMHLCVIDIQKLILELEEPKKRN